MRHLTPEEFIDLAERRRAESSAPHLRGCEQCRSELQNVRDTLASLEMEPTEVPEPSPIFWNQLSARVAEAIAAEAPRRRIHWNALPAWCFDWRMAIPIAASAAAILIAAVSLSVKSRTPDVASSPFSAVAPLPLVELPRLEPLGRSDDPSLVLVGELATTLDWDEVRQQVPLALHVGGEDEAFGALTNGERQELRRLLKEELAHQGA